MIEQILSIGGSWMINKQLVKLLGFEKVLFLTALKEKIGEGNSVSWTMKEIEEETLFKKRAQMRIIKDLEKRNLITTEIKGIPAKKYFQINENEINKLFNI